MRRGRYLFAVCAWLLASCAPQALVVKAPKVAVEPTKAAAVIPQSAPDNDARNDATVTGELQPIRSMDRETPLPTKSDFSSRFSSKDKLTVAVEAMPLRNFLNYVLGELLKVNFIVAESGSVLDQPITLNTQQAVSSRQLFRLTMEVLSGKGLSIIDKEGVLLVGPASGRGAGDITIGFGRRASDVPDVPGKIMQIVPWRLSSNISIDRILSSLTDVLLQQSEQQNAVFLTGTRSNILRALELIQMLDQPLARSSRIGVVSLTYIDSSDFINQVSTLLENDGITAGQGKADGKSVAFVPLDRVGAVVVFAPTTEILSRVEFWAKQVDRPNRGPSMRYFVFQPKYARAADLLESLAPMVGQSTASTNPQGNQSRDTRTALGAAGGGGLSQQSSMRAGAAAGGPTPAAVLSVQGDGISISADSRSNSLVIFTTGIKYESILPTIRRLDVPPKQILLEATIAEVSLSGEFANGVEFLFQRGKLSGGTDGSLGLPGGGVGLKYIANLTDTARLRLSANDSRINVLSSPIIVVRDGMEANIAVGNDVPTVGTTVSNPLQSDRTVLSVQYRQTGISLGIRPTVNAQGSVLMTIAQNISSTVPGASSVQGAPTFFTRSVSTEVVAQSGQSVLLAGLISDTGSSSSGRVPFLSRIPIAGFAFRSDSKKREKTELILLITPRIIETLEEWEDVKRALTPNLEYLSMPAPARVSSSAEMENGKK